MSELSLPEPDENALAHSQRVADAVASKIEQHGPLPFAEYMHLVLYGGGLGYYVSGNETFGATGDFVTAPETSPLFGHCLAHQIMEVLTEVPGDVLEIGAGSGVLALTLLLTLREEQQLPGRYLILEPSAVLQSRQAILLRQILPEDVFERVLWVSALPEQFEGVVIANEVLDAMPVEQFQLDPTTGEITQVYVTLSDKGLVTVNDSPQPGLLAAVEHIRTTSQLDWSPGFRSEVNLHITGWIAALGASLKRGLVLLLDYGAPRAELYGPARYEGTLRCFYRHRVHGDALLYPGLQDVTADVDFTAIAEATVPAGLDLHGYTSQAAFLLNTGLLDFSDSAEHMKEADRLKVSQEIQRLTSPEAMGERFQVMGLSRGLDIELAGFAGPDYTRRL